ncbi:signal peptidase I [Mycobacterium kansasii 732]|uniref:Signal peptidase I n=1 Tax=Mycobacterium pseudokansasii TaxID=2341080 RepID=A0A498QQ27_9MYCO|nr:signal peptidase I [Mycobacterium pseudokansasii]ETZ99191.1 signal peptidase I [Mycobacterium kansasii 732]KZS63198.1 signal peptidase I [Mycobacterium kansasii]MBY0388209.1 signal peptidase I [Mycobacterium pseudokansasii]VAZ92421.1 Signal peptidase I [Mycobacterium pseudokansasii]VAZ93530.1 Signal peptidase I [Mycobacterium pseudokansasii]
MTETTDSPSEREPGADQAASKPSGPESDITGETTRPAGTGESTEADNGASKPAKKSTLRELATLTVIAVVLYYVMLTFVARPYLIPSESMEPTLHGCSTCVGDRILVDKLTYRFSSPKPGDVIVFRGPPSWNVGYKSIRSSNTLVRWVQNALSFIGFVPPDENDLVKRVIAVGGQTVQCRSDTGLTVNGKPLREPYLDPTTMMADPSVYPCLGSEFGPVTVPLGRLWVMGDNRTHSADSRAHCPMMCTGDPMAGTVPISNVIGKARFIVWPPSRWGVVRSVNPQQGQ